MDTIAEVVSRLRAAFKGRNQDAFLTDRYLFSLCRKHAKLLMRRQDSQNKLMKFNPIFQSLDFVELEEVDRVQAGVRGLASGYKIKRTKLRLPPMHEGYYGPLIRSVFSLDGSKEIRPTYPSTFESFARQKNFRYITTRYYWYLDGYLYFPCLEYDAVKIEGVFLETTKDLQTGCETCVRFQDQRFNVPQSFFTEIEQAVKQELGLQVQIPSDPAPDKVNPLR